MHDTTNASTDLRGWARHGQQYESLPGQQLLFSERESDLISNHPVHPARRPELFETGKDLPGAMETDQAIFWDVM
jgi:hypothetical protein